LSDAGIVSMHSIGVTLSPCQVYLDSRDLIGDRAPMHPFKPEFHSTETGRAMLRELVGDVDPTGLELLRLVKIVSNQYDALVGERLRAADLSGSRWRLLLRLHGEEQDADSQGISPTHLSRCQNVSKNTISALLRGLEEQGLIERTLDPDDKRAFRIRLTEAGRARVRETAPQHLAFLNTLIEGLTPDERGQLIQLLGKLRHSLLTHAESQKAESSTSGGN